MAVVIPAWCMAMTSVYPSTITAGEFSDIDLRARSSPNNNDPL